MNLSIRCEQAYLKLPPPAYDPRSKLLCIALYGGLGATYSRGKIHKGSLFCANQCLTCGCWH